MDTFMDKLAQKLTAQEMINANTTAETEEMAKLREEVAQYKECLDRLQTLLEQGADRFENAQIDNSGIERLVEESLQKIRETQVDSTGIERLVEESLQKIREAQVDTAAIERLVDVGLGRLEQSGNDIERIADVSLAKLRQAGQSDEVIDQIGAIEKKVSELGNQQDENLADLGSIL